MLFSVHISVVLSISETLTQGITGITVGHISLAQVLHSKAPTDKRNQLKCRLIFRLRVSCLLAECEWKSEMKVLLVNAGIINSCVIVMYLQCTGAQLIADCLYCVSMFSCTYHSLYRITCSIIIIHFNLFVMTS